MGERSIRTSISRRLRGGVLVGVAALVIAACGSSSNATTSSSSATSSDGSASSSSAVTASGTTSTTGCGSLPTIAPDDPSGVVTALGSSYQSDYNGFTDYPVVKSPWANWKPAKKTGWNVQIVYSALTSPFQTAMLSAIEKDLKASGKVASIQVQSPAGDTDVPQQLQEFGTAIQRKPDIILFEPLAPAPSVSLIAQAAKAGIPTISIFNATPSPDAVSVGINPYLNAGETAAGTLKLMGGKGSVLEVHGVPGVQLDTDSFNAFSKALSRCPNVKLAGTVVGDFVSAATKGAVQQFLATHPIGVQGVFQAGVMGLGVIQAFAQTGHTPPPMADPGSVQGTVAYWHAHSSFSEVGTATPDEQIGNAMADVALRMLEGQGVKLNTLLAAPYLITKSNLNRVYESSFSLTSPMDVYGPSGTFMSDSYLNGFFNHPAAP